MNSESFPILFEKKKTKGGKGEGGDTYVCVLEKQKKKPASQPT